MGFMAGMTRSLRAAAGMLAAALVVAACGGGTSRETFTPTRLIVFGDESSVITSDGHKYTINALKAADGSLDCASNPIWVQYLASAYKLVFTECNPDASSDTKALMRATAGAKVADLVTQVDAHLAIDAFTGKDLVTVLAGANDIIEQYSAYPGQGEAELTATLTARGTAVAAQINRIANAGGKVLTVTVPDVGLTPFALAEKAAHTDVDRAALLQRLTSAFNTALRVNLLNDGTKIGLVIEDELVQAYVGAGTAVFANVTQSACDLTVAQPPNCTTNTLLKDSSGTTVIGSASTWLWADTLHLSPGGHSRLGSAALQRAQNNPF